MLRKQWYSPRDTPGMSGEAAQDHAEKTDSTNDVAVHAEGSLSTDSFSSDRSQCQFDEFGDLLSKMIEAERVRTDAKHNIDQERAVLRDLMDQEAICLAQMEHLAYRNQKAQTRGVSDLTDNEMLLSKLQKERSMCLMDQGKLLLRVRAQELRLENAVTQQAEGEPILLRAVRGFIRNARASDPDENVMPRVFAEALRVAVDCWKVEKKQRLRRVQKPPCELGSARAVESDGCIFLSWDHEASLGEEIFRFRMARCYATVEPTLIRHGVLDPSPVQAPASNVQLPPGRSAECDNFQNPSRQQKLLELGEAHRRIDEVRDWLLWPARFVC